MTTIATQSPGLWANQTVDMPGMGPGANKAGWWVAYLNELMMLGKYDEVLAHLNKARATGAIFAIIKAKEEMTQQYIQKKLNTSNKKGSVGPRVKKAKTSKQRCTEPKTDPYFYTREREKVVA